MPPSDALTLARELLDQQDDAPLPHEAARWVRVALRRWMNGDNLEQAFRLDRASRLRARNAALMDAAEILGADGCEPWVLACRLAEAIRRHEARITPLVARDPAYPLGPVDAALRRAFATGLRIPTTARRIYDLIC